MYFRIVGIVDFIFEVFKLLKVLWILYKDSLEKVKKRRLVYRV